MATQVIMPRQGQSVESCIILEWKVTEGDSVKQGDILCEVETDKATFEIEAPEDGSVLKILHGNDADVEVLAPIAFIGKAGENIDALLPVAESAEETVAKSAEVSGSEETAQPANTAVLPVVQTGSCCSTGISPRAKALALTKGIDAAGLAGTGPQGRIIERDIVSAMQGRQPASPAAVAAAAGSTLPASGSGIGGRVLLADIGAAAQLQPEGVSAPALTFPGQVKEIAVKGVRKLISDRMHASLSTTAQLTLNASADASTLLSYRKRLKGSPEELGLGKVTINDLVLYATAKTLLQCKEMNAHFLGDKIIEFEHVHLGVAVDTPKGLMVPVVKYADLKSLKEISIEAKRLTNIQKYV